MTQQTVGIVGLGYVGLPLAVAFGKKMATIGFDLSAAKVDAYRRFTDPTGEVSGEELREATGLKPTTDPAALSGADVLIVAVPTPVDSAHQPDFGPLVSACRAIGPHLKRGATVVFESTVYPGATEEVCVPALEAASGKRWKTDFFVGYSPERINPGDKEHTLTKIVKVVAGDSPETLDRLATLYGMVVEAGIHRATSIRVAEAAKVIENTQRDLNIALMNELAIIFHRMNIDTREVLDAAQTKWNFLPFKPGLVGGHCIGVDPYYLTYQAEKFGHHPEVILAGRRINDTMGKYVAEQTVKCLASRGSLKSGAKVNVLGFTFKENCPDARNTKVIDVVNELKEYGLDVAVHDPVADAGDVREHYGIELTAWEDLPQADTLVVAVAHRDYVAMPQARLTQKLAQGGCVVDVKAALNRAELTAAGYLVWRL
jgi:UDP-N-acetyl-D-galactosamine dehydrogenase